MKAKLINASRITILLFAVFLFLGTSAFGQNKRRMSNNKTTKSTNTAVSKKDTLSGLNNVINNTGSFDSNTHHTGQAIDASVTISPGTIPPVSPPSVVTSTNTSSGNDVSVSTSTTTSSGNTVNQTTVTTTESGSSTATQPPKKKK
jgi:hypothetical protein